MPATVIHTKPAKPVTNDNAETVVSEFIDAHGENLPDGVGNQLLRLQRELRGLPPQMQLASEAN